MVSRCVSFPARETGARAAFVGARVGCPEHDKKHEEKGNRQLYRREGGGRDTLFTAPTEGRVH